MINCNILPPHKFPTFTRRHASYQISTTYAIFLVKIHTQKNIINRIHQLVNFFQLNNILVWFHPLDYKKYFYPIKCVVNAYYVFCNFHISWQNFLLQCVLQVS